jgi:lipid-A-disaccharide synthase
MKYFIIAGERSGDMHAARLAKEIKRNDIRAELVGVGGKYMGDAEVKILKHYSTFSFMGIWEVIANLRKVKKTIKDLKRAIKEQQPHVLILVDFPGINLKMATYAKKLGIKTCYYISPKIWAWKEHRIKRIKRDIDKMLVILPFEVEYYKGKGFEVEYVGNPLIDSIKDYKYDPRFEVDPNQTTIAVLPGSRKQEIESSAKVVAEIAKKAGNYKFLIAGVDNVGAELYEPYLNIKNAEIHFDKTYDIVKRSNAAIVTSGTATLETALLNCPQVVVYRANPISIFIARLLVKIKWISLVNLIAQKEVVKELIQEDYNADKVLEELNNILYDHHYCAGMMQDYQELLDKIGAEPASRKAGRIIAEWLEE